MKTIITATLVMFTFNSLITDANAISLFHQYKDKFRTAAPLKLKDIPEVDQATKEYFVSSVYSDNPNNFSQTFDNEPCVTRMPDVFEDGEYPDLVLFSANPKMNLPIETIRYLYASPSNRVYSDNPVVQQSTSLRKEYRRTINGEIIIKHLYTTGREGFWLCEKKQ